MPTEAKSGSYQALGSNNHNTPITAARYLFAAKPTYHHVCHSYPSVVTALAMDKSMQSVPVLELCKTKI